LKLFPVGEITTGSSLGSIDSTYYSMFEPNAGCKSNKVHTTLLTTFQDQTMLSRKKAEPYLSITYEYVYIYDKEYRQIEHFVDEVDDALTSFYTVDWTKGRTPSAVASSAGNWVVSLDYTRDYSATSNMKSNYAMIYDGKKWKVGEVTALTANTSITVDVDEGALKHSTIVAKDTLVCPLYNVRLTQNNLANFERTVFWPDESVTRTGRGGFMRSGSVNFISTHKV